MSYVALIADDDEFFRIALRTILTRDLSFNEVVETASLDEAIEQLSSRKDFSLALFDLSMPGMESPANLATVRDFHPEMIIAVVSGSSRRTDMMAALRAGVHGYIPKDIGVAELTEALRRVAGGNIFLPPSFADYTSPAERAVETEGPTVVPAKNLLDVLTPRQRDVLELVVMGDSNKRIADKLGLSEGTIKIHLAALFRNLGVHNRAAAAVSGSRLFSAKSAPESE